MSTLDEKLLKATSAIFTKFAVTLAKSEPMVAATIVAGAAGVVLSAGIVTEIVDQARLLSESGPAALKAYQANSATSFLQLLGRGLAGDLPSRGLALESIGTWAMITCPPIAYAMTKMAKGLDIVKDAAMRDYHEHRPRGATRLNELNSIMDSVESMKTQQAAPAAKPRGLGN